MQRALTLADSARGLTSPNPLVGALVVRDGVVVGEGYHARAGAPHAERLALDAAGEAARGATLYVALEPCVHQGRTPPCVPAVLGAGIRRVVVAVLDPNPRVSGGGVAALRQAGLDVSVGCLEAEAPGTAPPAGSRVKKRGAKAIGSAANQTPSLWGLRPCWQTTPS
jgi:diaminohydroxyphosphoribosylaminopyrimidine deaminase/5-amino-6-(5-phosphoribosylamino)uracil reductase